MCVAWLGTWTAVGLRSEPRVSPIIQTDEGQVPDIHFGIL
jgi:hypothetical protein